MNTGSTSDDGDRPLIGPRKARRTAKREPPWFVQDVVIALMIGLLLAALQIWVEDNRSDRQERLENLRFVRDRSSSTQLDRPFSGIDLAEMNLSGLSLAAADFKGARLDGVRFTLAGLEGAHFEDASMRNADLREADLSRVNFGSTVADGANFTRAVLRGAQLVDSSFTNVDFKNAGLFDLDFAGSSFDRSDFFEAKLTRIQLVRADLSSSYNLETATFDQVCYDERTKWPDGFSPPPQDGDICDKFQGSSWRQTPYG